MGGGARCSAPQKPPFRAGMLLLLALVVLAVAMVVRRSLLVATVGGDWFIAGSTFGSFCFFVFGDKRNKIGS